MAELRSLFTHLPRYLIALVAVGLISVAIGLVLESRAIANISMLYLIVILATATRLGPGPAIFASLAAFLIFDWFFVVPYHTLTVADPEEWLSLVLFLVTAIITGQLAARERLRAQQAERREREAVLLFDTLRLMSAPETEVALQTLAERIRSELHVNAVGIALSIGARAQTTVAGDTDAAAVLSPHSARATEVMNLGQRPTNGASGSTGRWIKIMPPNRAPAFEAMGSWRRYEVPIQVDQRLVGRLTLVRDSSGSRFGQLENRFLGVIATQLGILVQRAEGQQAATDAALLRQANELKSALLNAVSHDLRTPLASILASAGSLRQHDVPWTDEDREEFAMAIEQQTERLNRIVGNLLDLSRIEGGALRPDRELRDLGGLIADVVERLGNAITLRIEDDLPPVLLDFSEIDQVLTNLIENAVKYAPAGKSVEVSCWREGSEVVVEVADRGPGVPPEEIPRVFEPFYRVAGLGPRGSGLGLGLAVAKGLVEAHRGRIWVENRQGGGARFLFSLPAPTAAPARDEPLIERAG